MEATDPRQTRQDPEQIGAVDLLVGLLDGGDAANAVAMIREATGKLTTPIHTVVTGSGALQAGSGSLQTDNSVPKDGPVQNLNGDAAAVAQERGSLVVLPGPRLAGRAVANAERVGWLPLVFRLGREAQYARRLRGRLQLANRDTSMVLPADQAGHRDGL